MDLSPEQKKIKKTKLSKTIGTQKLSKEAILNRMSSGKKRPKSETKIKKGSMKTPSKEDLVAKKLFFQDGSDNDNSVDRDVYQSPVKSKNRTKNGGDDSTKKGSSSKKLQSSTSKWQVSQGTPSIEKQDTVKDQDVMEMTKSGKKKKKKATDKKVDEEDDDDVEIDFPILKRKSLGLEEFKATLASQKSPQKVQQVPKEVSENGQSKKKKKKKAPEDSMSKDVPSKKTADQITGEGKGKKKRKKRGKKRKRSNSESDEPQAKKGKPVREGFAVRCGNLPVGVRKDALRMFIGEADIFPSNIIFKRKRKGVPGEKKQSFTYATVICNSSEEAEKLCKLNGITMPSPVGNKERKLLIHMLNEDGGNDDPAFKKKLFVGNLNPKVNEEELLAFFKTNDCNPTNVIVPKRGSDRKSRGYAFVWLTTAGDADRALKLRKPTLRDQVISIARSYRHPGKQEP